MLPRERLANLMLFVIEGDVVLDFIELFPRIFRRGLRANSITRRKMLKGCSLSRMRLGIMMFPPVCSSVFQWTAFDDGSPAKNSSCSFFILPCSFVLGGAPKYHDHIRYESKDAK